MNTIDIQNRTDTDPNEKLLNQPNKIFARHGKQQKLKAVEVKKNCSDIENNNQVL